MMSKLTLNKQKELLAQAKKDNEKGIKTSIQKRWYDESKLIEKYVNVNLNHKNRTKPTKLSKEEFEKRFVKS